MHTVLGNILGTVIRLLGLTAEFFGVSAVSYTEHSGLVI